MAIQEGMTAPDFRLTAHDGKQVTLSEYSDRQNLVIYFMREFG